MKLAREVNAEVFSILINVQEDGARVFLVLTHGADRSGWIEPFADRRVGVGRGSDVPDADRLKAGLYFNH